MSLPECMEIPEGDVVIKNDPHHGGTCQWTYYRGEFWHRTSPLNKKWVRVKKVGLTAARVLMLNEILVEGSP